MPFNIFAPRHANCQQMLLLRHFLQKLPGPGIEFRVSLQFNWGHKLNVWGYVGFNVALCGLVSLGRLVPLLDLAVALMPFAARHGLSFNILGVRWNVSTGGCFH